MTHGCRSGCAESPYMEAWAGQIYLLYVVVNPADIPCAWVKTLYNY